MQDTLNPDRRYLCRHVHTDGRRCGSPALRGQNFCYYHDRQRLQNAPLAGRLGIFRFQPIEDRSAIQIALYDILSRVSAGDLDNKRASILLYGLQIASSNLARQEKLQPATQPLDDVTNHHILGDLAPIEELPTDEPAAPQHPVILSEAVCNANSEVEGADTPPAPPLPPESFNPEITTALQPPQHPVILSEAVRNANSEVEGPDTPPAPPLPPEPFSPEALNEESEEDLVLAAGQTTVRHSLTLHAVASIWNRSTRPEPPQPAIRLSYPHHRHNTQVVAGFPQNSGPVPHSVAVSASPKRGIRHRETNYFRAAGGQNRSKPNQKLLRSEHLKH